MNGHPERYRECSEKVYRVLTTFSPLVEMASIDEAYLDMTGTSRLHGPPLGAAHTLHRRIKSDTQLNCSIGIGSPRLIAKVSSAKAKPHGILWVIPGQEAKFLAPLDVRDIPGVGRSLSKICMPWAFGRSEIWLALTIDFSKNILANGDWPWPAKRVAKMPVDGLIPRSEPITIPNQSATNTLTTKTPPIPSRSNPP